MLCWPPPKWKNTIKMNSLINNALVCLLLVIKCKGKIRFYLRTEFVFDVYRITSLKYFFQVKKVIDHDLIQHDSFQDL